MRAECAHSALDAKVVAILEMLVTSSTATQYQDGRNFDGPGQLTLKTSDHGRQESYINVRKSQVKLGGSRCKIQLGTLFGRH